MRKQHRAGEDEDERVDMGSAGPNEQSLSSLEEKYSEQMRQIFPTKIDLPWLTLKTQIDEQINLRPDFQRRDRWNNEKRSRFIESVIMNVPVPPVFLGEEEYGKYVVLDGRQRLTAAYKFLSNELRLEGLQVWKELNGLTYAEIKKKGFAATIDHRQLLSDQRRVAEARDSAIGRAALAARRELHTQPLPALPEAPKDSPEPSQDGVGGK